MFAACCIMHPRCCHWPATSWMVMVVLRTGKWLKKNRTEGGGGGGGGGGGALDGKVCEEKQSRR